MKTKLVISCDYSEIEDIIREEYGHIYEIMPMEEIGSSQHSEISQYTVSKGILEDYQELNINSLKEGKPKKYSLDDILQDLSNKDKLEPGDYFIDVSW